MSDAGLFLVGAIISLLAGTGIGGLVLAAIADGRDNDRIQAGLVERENSVPPTGA